MSKEFAGLVAIVTGAGSGIGLEVAKGLTERGATVFGFDINQGEMASVATFIKCDIAMLHQLIQLLLNLKKQVAS